MGVKTAILLACLLIAASSAQRVPFGPLTLEDCFTMHEACKKCTGRLTNNQPSTGDDLATIINYECMEVNDKFSWKNLELCDIVLLKCMGLREGVQCLSCSHLAALPIVARTRC